MLIRDFHVCILLYFIGFRVKQGNFFAFQVLYCLITDDLTELHNNDFSCTISPNQLLEIHCENIPWLVDKGIDKNLNNDKHI